MPPPGPGGAGGGPVPPGGPPAAPPGQPPQGPEAQLQPLQPGQPLQQMFAEGDPVPQKVESEFARRMRQAKQNQTKAAKPAEDPKVKEDYLRSRRSAITGQVPTHEQLDAQDAVQPILGDAYRGVGKRLTADVKRRAEAYKKEFHRPEKWMKIYRRYIRERQNKNIKDPRLHLPPVPQDMAEQLGEGEFWAYAEDGSVHKFCMYGPNARKPGPCPLPRPAPRATQVCYTRDTPDYSRAKVPTRYRMTPQTGTDSPASTVEETGGATSATDRAAPKPPKEKRLPTPPPASLRKGETEGCSTDAIAEWLRAVSEQAEACLGNAGPVPPEADQALKYLAGLQEDLGEFFGTQEEEEFDEDHWAEAEDMQEFAEQAHAPEDVFEGPSGRLFQLKKFADGKSFVLPIKAKRSKRPVTPRFAQTHAEQDGESVRISTPRPPGDLEQHIHLTVNMPEGKTPVINVAAPEPQPAPVVNVDVAAPNVTVSPPSVNVETPAVTVLPAPVTFAEKEDKGPMKVEIVSTPKIKKTTKRNKDGDITEVTEENA